MSLFIASQQVFIVIIDYFVIDSVRKRLDTLSYLILLVFIYATKVQIKAKKTKRN
jgi:hypothetical protein